MGSNPPTPSKSNSLTNGHSKYHAHQGPSNGQSCTKCSRPPVEPISFMCLHVSCLSCVADQNNLTCPTCSMWGPQQSSSAIGTQSIRVHSVSNGPLNRNEWDPDRERQEHQVLNHCPFTNNFSPRLRRWESPARNSNFFQESTLPQPQLCEALTEPFVRNKEHGWRTVEQNGNGIEVLKPLDGPISCLCEDANPVTVHCKTCSEDLCEICCKAHQRVKVTQCHVVVRYPTPLAFPSSESSSLTPSSDKARSGQTSPPDAESALSCLVPASEVLQVYTDAVEKAKGDCDSLLNKTQLFIDKIEDAKIQVFLMKTRVDERSQSIKSEIDSYVAQIYKEVQNRQDFLAHRLESVVKIKHATLDNQLSDLEDASGSLIEVFENLSKAISFGKPVDLVKHCTVASTVLQDVSQAFGTISVREDDVFQFQPPITGSMKSMSMFGLVGGSAFAKNSFVEGPGVRKAIVGKEARFGIRVNDHLNEQRKSGGDLITVKIQDPSSRPVPHTIQDGQNGSYRIAWKPSVEGEHKISITIKELHIQGSPFTATARHGRDYFSIGQPILIFGVEGSKDGELCRPWGVCCSLDGYILVANRSNNRIEVFTATGVFHSNFGTSGEGQGQFNRPSSVFCDSQNRVVIADKDNHRIQIMTIKGEFIQIFGSKGSKPGQFNYPWDVACNTLDQILVSDTRNHRVQLFDKNGEFLRKFGYESANWKHLDSPRGVFFRSDNQAVVTDFNNHRLLVVDLYTHVAKSLGHEGSGNGFFIRPNGVAVDEEGYIMVADSRNDRVQIFTPEGVFVKQIGGKGSEPGQLDRPCGVCVSPDGKIIVVDFGNNRIQVF